MLAKVIPFKPQETNFSEVISAYINSSNSKETIKNYTKQVRAFYKVSDINEVTFEMISTTNTNMVREHLSSISETSHDNMNQFCCALTKLYDYALEYSEEYGYNLNTFNPFNARSVKDFIKSHKVVKVNSVSDNSIEVLDPQIPKLIIQEIRNDIKSASKLRDELIIKTAYHCAMRVGEIISLKVENFVKYNGLFFIFIKHGKGNKDRVVNISEKFYTEIMTYALSNNLESHDEVFRVRGNKPFKSKKAVNNIIHKYEAILKEKGLIDENLNITAHKFRHLSATNQIAEGINVKDLSDFLGHSSVNTSQRYINVSTQLSNDYNAKLYDRQFN